MIYVFQLHRDADATGCSGTGVVAEGAFCPDGYPAAVQLWWRPGLAVAAQSGGAYGAMRDVEQIHGHGGRTRVVWVGPRPPARLLGRRARNGRGGHGGRPN